MPGKRGPRRQGLPAGRWPLRAPAGGWLVAPQAPRGLSLSTVALEGSRGIGTAPRGLAIASYADLVLALAALAVFLVAGLPLVGYAATASAWVATRLAGFAAERHAAKRLAAGERRAAIGIVAAVRLGRVWVVVLAVLVAGLAGSHDDGLAAALLAVALFTAYLAGTVVTRLGAQGAAS